MLQLNMAVTDKEVADLYTRFKHADETTSAKMVAQAWVLKTEVLNNAEMRNLILASARFTMVNRPNAFDGDKIRGNQQQVQQHLHRRCGSQGVRSGEFVHKSATQLDAGLSLHQRVAARHQSEKRLVGGDAGYEAGSPQFSPPRS